MGGIWVVAEDKHRPSADKRCVVRECKKSEYFGKARLMAGTTNQGWLKLALLAVVLAAALIVLHATPLQTWFSAEGGLRETLSSLGWWAPAIFLPLAAAGIAIGVPRLLVCWSAGFIFGALYGVLWSEIGSLAGAYAVFLFVRWAGRDMALRRWPLLERYGERLGNGGLITVLMVRVLPIHSLISSAALALTPMPHRTFLLGSAAGFLVEGIPATLIGASIIGESLRHSLIYASVAVVFIVIAGLFLARYRKEAQKRMAGANGERENDNPQR